MSDAIGPAIPPHLRSSRDIDESDSKREKLREENPIGPMLPPWLRRNEESSELQDEKDSTGGIGPSLPPNMRKEDQKEDSFGPSLPPGFGTRPTIAPSMPKTDNAEVSDDDPVIGPSPPSVGLDHTVSVAEEIEKRSKKMKDRLTGKEEPKKLEREEWMTELPPLLQGFGGPGPRKFRAHERIIGDRSVWTDTPADKERKAAQRNENPQISDQDKIHMDACAKKDLEAAEKLANTADPKRKESLMSMHEKKMKRKAQEAEASGEAKIRRPFDRELDLQTNRFDEAAKKRMMKQSQGLSSRFASGAMTTKFL